jgi:antitoxin (DNA-binding transcriptional repressor) of toxin-antitoxin stability system
VIPTGAADRDRSLHSQFLDIGLIDSVGVVIHDGSMEPVGIHNAQIDLASLLRRAAMGEDVVIARGDEPIARIIRLAPPQTQRLGIDEGKYTVPDEFNQPITRDGLDVFGL